MMGRSPRGGSTATWSGLAACSLALTGLVMGASPAPTEPVREASTEYCPPGAARVADPGVAEATEVTPEQAAEYDEELREALVPLRGHEFSAPHTVPVVVHVISAEDGTGAISDSRVDEQLDVLNRAYRGDFATGSEGTDTGFRFQLSSVERTTDDTWFNDFNQHSGTIRSSLRQGGPETLNIYTAELDSGLLGFSTFPQDYSDQDGVVVDHNTLPGGDRDRFNEGQTATHEVGHWLGLFHTFQNGCQSPGDYVDDTPYEREAASGCPIGRNTCPERPGRDPVTNFMNYSDDACMTHFTPGQAERMVEHWAAFRSNPRG
ncbi:zinc metalloprotease [Nocardiopsis oceani]